MLAGAACLAARSQQIGENSFITIKLPLKKITSHLNHIKCRIVGCYIPRTEHTTNPPTLEGARQIREHLKSTDEEENDGQDQEENDRDR